MGAASGKSAFNFQWGIAFISWDASKIPLGFTFFFIAAAKTSIKQIRKSSLFAHFIGLYLASCFPGLLCEWSDWERKKAILHVVAGT